MQRGQPVIGNLQHFARLNIPDVAGADQIKTLIVQAIERKPPHHHLDEWKIPAGRVMSEIGG